MDYSDILEIICPAEKFEFSSLSDREGWQLAVEWIRRFSVTEIGVSRNIQFHPDEILNLFLDFPTIPFQRGGHALASLAEMNVPQKIYFLTPMRAGTAYEIHGSPSDLRMPNMEQLTLVYENFSIPIMPVFVDVEFLWTSVLATEHQGPFFCRSLTNCLSQ